MNGMNIPVGPLSYCRPHLALSFCWFLSVLLVKGFKKKTPTLNGSGSQKVNYRTERFLIRFCDMRILCSYLRVTSFVVTERFFHDPVRKNRHRDALRFGSVI